MHKVTLITSREPRAASHARSRAAVAIVAGALLLAGCDYMPFGYTHVKDIVAKPAEFEGKEVKLKGRVRSARSIMGIKAYTLREETGEISIVTQVEPPKENTDVTLKGIVKSTVIFGGSTSVGLRIEETKRIW